MRAKVQGRFPFLGKMRSPGDVLTEKELLQTTPQVRDALVSQKLIILDPDTGGERIALDAFGDQLKALTDRVATLEERDKKRSQRLVG